MLLNKNKKYCVEKLDLKKKKTDSKCSKGENETYLYPSETGFWILDQVSRKLIHLSDDSLIESVVEGSAKNSIQKVDVHGVRNTAVLEVGSDTVLFIVKDNQIVSSGSVKGSRCNSVAVNFEGEKRAQYLDLNCFSIVNSQYILSTVETIDGSINESKEITKIEQKGELEKVWFGKEEDVRIISASFEGGIFVFYGANGKSKWDQTSELGSAVEVLVAEFESQEESQEIPIYESYGKNLLGASVFRATSDINNLVLFVKTLIPRILSIDFQEIVDKILGKSETTVKEDVSYYNKYGLRKNLIFVTSSNRLISIDSLSGKDLWSLTLKQGQSVIKSLINHNNNIDLIYMENGVKKRTEIDSYTGKFISQDVQVDQRATLFYESPDSEAPIEIGFDSNFLKNTNTEFSFYRVNKKEGIFGYRRTKAGKFEEVWTYLLEKDQEIIDYSYHLKNDNQYIEKSLKGSMITLPEEEALYFRVVDSGNVALLIRQTLNNQNVLMITIINTVRGKVLGSYITDSIDFTQPIGFVYDDNGVYTSYFNEKIKGYELWSIEIYKTKVEVSFIEMYVA